MTIDKKYGKTMAMTWEGFRAEAPKRDEEARKAQAVAEALEDAYYDALSAEIDAHPIGRPMPHGGYH